MAAEMTDAVTPPTDRPTCATCGWWHGEHDPPIEQMRQCKSPIRAPWLPDSGRVWCGHDHTCPHHTPRTDDATE